MFFFLFSPFHGLVRLSLYFAHSDQPPLPITRFDLNHCEFTSHDTTAPASCSGASTPTVGCRFGTFSVPTAEESQSVLSRTHQQRLRVRRQRWKSAVELHHMLDELRLSLADPDQVSPCASIASSPSSGSYLQQALAAANRSRPLSRFGAPSPVDSSAFSHFESSSSPLDSCSSSSSECECVIALSDTNTESDSESPSSFLDLSGGLSSAFSDERPAQFGSAVAVTTAIDAAHRDSSIIINATTEAAIASFEQPIAIKTLADQSALISYSQHLSVPSVSASSLSASHAFDSTLVTKATAFCHSDSSSCIFFNDCETTSNSPSPPSSCSSPSSFSSSSSPSTIVNSNIKYCNSHNLTTHSSPTVSLDSIVCPSKSAKMQTLAETQYNHLAYHIAALSCARLPSSSPSSSSSSSPSSSTSPISGISNVTNGSAFNSCASQATAIKSDLNKRQIASTSPSSSSLSSSVCPLSASVDEDSAYSSGSSSSCSPFSSPYNSPPGSPSSNSVFSDSSSDSNLSPPSSDNELLSNSSHPSSSPVACSSASIAASLSLSLPVAKSLPVKTRKIGVVHPPIDFNNNRSVRLLSIAQSPVAICASAPASVLSNNEITITALDTLCSTASSSDSPSGSSSSSPLPLSSLLDQTNSLKAPEEQAPASGEQPRVRKTSILRSQTPTDGSQGNASSSTSGSNGCCKKEVKFADTLGFELEKIKYFPPGSPQTRVKRHSINVIASSLEFGNVSTNGSASAAVASSVWGQSSQPTRKRSEPHWFGGHVSDYWSQYAYEHLRPHSQLTLNAAGNDRSKSGSCDNVSCLSSNGFTCNPFNLDKYCGDMFDAQLPDLPLITSLESGISLPSNDCESDLRRSNSNNLHHHHHHHHLNSSSSASTASTGSSLSSSSKSSMLTTVSLLPLNFGQPFIQSEFPARLRAQSVLLHSVQCSSGRLVGLVSVWNHTFEKRVTIRYSTDKWASERQAEARYVQPDRLASADQFHFELRLQSDDFGAFSTAADSDRTLMFAVRYETADHRVYWDNNYGQDYRIRCRL